MHRATVVIIHDPITDRIVLGRKKRGPFGAKLMPPGGKIEHGQSAHECAVLETKDETGLIVDMRHLEQVGFFASSLSGEPQFAVDVFRTSAFTGELLPETIEMYPAWYESTRLPFDEMLPSDRLWLPDAIKGISFVGSFEFGSDYSDLTNLHIKRSTKRPSFP
ncbi:NUDIX domain-containing protein [Candidatus Parcubacteria bacterium]|nr:MAG: NUDIX domain-containing protein [Candidatus Parcubacteria bacterium]